MSTVTMMNVSWLCCLALFAWAPLSFSHCVAVCAVFPVAFVALSHLLEESPLWMVP